MMDVDYFKLVNDCYGYIVGDSVLVGIVGVLIEVMWVLVDLFVWIGGEEFVILLFEIGL